MNFAMWKKALQVIPAVSKQEWDALDFVSKWLISTRAAVLEMSHFETKLSEAQRYIAQNHLTRGRFVE